MGGGAPRTLRVDGGMAGNDWFCQFLADISCITGRAAGHARGDRAGRSLSRRAHNWRVSHIAAISTARVRGARFEPCMAEAKRERLIEGWRDAVQRTLTRDRAR